MNGIRRIDAGKLPCPQPATLNHKVLHNLAKGTAQVLMSSSNARENVFYLFRDSCWGVIINHLSEGSSWMMLKNDIP